MSTADDKYKRDRFLREKVKALRLLAVHMHLIPPCNAFAPTEIEVRESIERHAPDILLCLLVVIDTGASPISKAAARTLLDIYAHGWRNFLDDSVLGYVVERDDPEVRIWRESVLSRDDYKCVLCEAVDNLEAHHIIRWADSPELRLDIHNGKTLCVSCHLKEHHGQETK